ncbi:NAD(P)-dependent oxidoreductase [Enterocloster bolteae]|jgi:hypothetical protein|uniref:NAD(P)-dependent oxidoreductase n=2 Tax=Bacillati TaxID=1783272 RepID=UPI00110696CE|nr:MULTISPECIES: NAD(P)-dependent oxidoreductase [Clostridia]MCB7091774.1 NAD(P)-dependent oxidoreductase [Enterocloster bolteae]MCH1938349.1 NAD(P)-dependent oxidoreductase [Enterocloster sp. OA11]
MILVGSTGFVGSNLIEYGAFDKKYHSTDVNEAYGSKPDVLVYAGVTGTKFWANMFPEKDADIICQAKTNIEKICPKKIILISSIDVNSSLDSDEQKESDKSFFCSYGNNRLELEKWISSNYEDYHIIRLPAIYGKNIKKNYIHDLISPIPPILTLDKYNDILKVISEITDAYSLHADGLYHYNESYSGKKSLEEKFIKNPFNAISFTNPRSSFQYYNLAWLWNDINRIMEQKIKKINLVTEPIFSNELFELVYHCEYWYESSAPLVNYNLKTAFAEALGGHNGYIYKKEYVLKDLINYIKKYKMR